MLKSLPKTAFHRSICPRFTVPIPICGQQLRLTRDGIDKMHIATWRDMYLQLHSLVDVVVVIVSHWTGWSVDTLAQHRRSSFLLMANCTRSIINSVLLLLEAPYDCCSSAVLCAPWPCVVMPFSLRLLHMAIKIWRAHHQPAKCLMSGKICNRSR